MLNQKGNAAIEMLPILSLFVLLVNFGMGFFGIIHSGILNSIAARNYAFETFRNRANLNYLRDEGTSASFADNPNYWNANFRFHSIVEEGAQTNTWTVTKRPLKFTEMNTGINVTSNASDQQTVRSKMTDESKKTSEYFTGQTPQDGNSGVSPVWVMTSYGICLNSVCEGI